MYRKKVVLMSLVVALVSIGTHTKVQASELPTTPTSIKVLNEDLFIGVAEDSTENAAPMIVEPARATDSQLWVFDPQSDGTYAIRNVRSDLLADVWWISDEEGAEVNQGVSYGPASNQKWEAINVGGRAWQFKAQHSGLYLAVDNNGIVQSATPGTFTFGYLPPSAPRSPSPEDEATDVPRDVTLSWTPGRFAATHDVYLGMDFNDVNDASRIDPLGVLVGEDQEPNTFDPNRLAFDTTYYWRVDEVNAAPDSTVFKGDLWSFTTETLGYPIENVTATASSEIRADEGAENTINGSGIDDSNLH